ncbi:MAG TPA: proton-conducting transporter membrane subunit [Planctomycetota bacterium]
MQWLLDLPHGVRSAAVLGLFATVVLVGAVRLRTASCSAIALLASLFAAIPTILAPTAETFPVLLVLTALIGCELLMRSDDLADAQHRAESVALQLLGAAGACVLATAQDWLSLLIGFESMSLAVAVLAGLGRGVRSLEVAFRFFVLSAVAAATMVYGIALFSYATGSFALDAAPLVHPGHAALARAAVLLIALGLAFELAVVPSHLGTLGICYGAPLSCITFAMTVSKVAAALAMMRLCAQRPELQPVVAVLAVLSIVWSTFGGLAQQHVRGMLAYSAVGHGGFLALAAACGPAAQGTVGYYTLVYVASVALVLAALSGQRGELSFAEIARTPIGGMRRFALVLGLLSLAGVPPSPGFLAKIAVLSQAWGTAGPWLTIGAALGGVFGALYYLKPVPDLLAMRGVDVERVSTPTRVRIAIALSGAAALLCMVVPNLPASWLS